MPTWPPRPLILCCTVVLIGCATLYFALHARAAARFTGCGGERPASTNLAFELEVVARINQARAEVSLPPLQYNADLSDAARYHAFDMNQDDYFDHDSHDRVDGELVYACKWIDRLRAYFPALSASENIAWGYSTPEAVVTGWLASAGHRRNILGSSWEVGIGINNNVWVADFSRRSDYFPLIIERGARTTNQTTVTIHIYGEWTDMRLRTNGGDWGEWQPFQADFAWQLAPTFGTQVVEAELRGGAASALASDEIELVDPNAPTPTPTATETPTLPPCTVVCLDVKVTFEGRPPAPNSRWVVPLVAKLVTLPDDGGPAIITFTRPTSVDGVVRLTSLTSGSYALLLKGAHTLQRRVEVTLSEGVNQVDVGLLSEGDILADNRVDLLDFSLLSPAYSACLGAAAFQAQADLNEDGCIAVDDLELLRRNYGDKGEESATLLAATVQTDPPPALVVHSKQPGDRFAVSIAVNQAAGQQVNAGAFYLDYNPQLLRARHVSAERHFTTTLQSTLDLEQGRVDYAAGILNSSLPAPFEFARVVFDVLQPFDETTLVVATSDGRRTDLASAGASLTARIAGGTAALFTLQEVAAGPDQLLYLPLVQR